MDRHEKDKWGQIRMPQEKPETGNSTGRHGIGFFSVINYADILLLQSRHPNDQNRNFELILDCRDKDNIIIHSFRTQPCSSQNEGGLRIQALNLISYPEACMQYHQITTHLHHTTAMVDIGTCEIQLGREIKESEKEKPHLIYHTVNQEKVLVGGSREISPIVQCYRNPSGQATGIIADSRGLHICQVDPEEPYFPENMRHLFFLIEANNLSFTVNAELTRSRNRFDMAMIPRIKQEIYLTLTQALATLLHQNMLQGEIPNLPEEFMKGKYKKNMQYSCQIDYKDKGIREALQHIGHDDFLKILAHIPIINEKRTSSRLPT